VILFDEIEKAHPDVFNVLLQVLDDGRLTDGQGRTVDFRNTLIIMTSNLGLRVSGQSDRGSGRGPRARRGDERGARRRSGRNSSTGRRDHPVPPPARSEMGAIVDIQLKRLGKLLADRKIDAQAGRGSALIWLADKGYDPAYGARPLKRVFSVSNEKPAEAEAPQGEAA
jgi:ATP-dependent Clp protease ATP-binding subunit ClpB